MKIKTIETVARLLGLEIVGNVFKYPLGGEEMYCDPGRFPFMVVNFAAYAKAEMAKRGWTPFAEGTTGGYSIQFFDEYGEQANGNGQTTACHDYDPRDPIAEANSTLLAIAEALTVPPNAEAHRAP